MHKVQEINRKVLYPQLETYNCSKLSHSVPNNIPRNFSKLYNSSIEIDIQESGKSLTQNGIFSFNLWLILIFILYTWNKK